MRPKIFYVNEKGNIEFTKEQLEKLINEIYDEGKTDGINYHHVEYVPYQIPYQAPTIDWNRTITCNASDDYGVYFLEDDSIGRATLLFEKLESEKEIN